MALAAKSASASGASEAALLDGDEEGLYEAAEGCRRAAAPRIRRLNVPAEAGDAAAPPACISAAASPRVARRIADLDDILLQEASTSRERQGDAMAAVGSTRRLFIGSAEHARDDELLAAHGVTHVIMVAQELRERTRVSPLLQYCSVALADHAGYDLLDRDGAEVRRALLWIDAALHSDDGARVLVACHMGVNRSVTVALTYAMLRAPRAELCALAAQTRARRRHAVLKNETLRAALAGLDRCAWRAWLGWAESSACVDLGDCWTPPPPASP